MAKKNGWNEWSLTLLRVVIGLIFVMHGYPKLFVEGGFTGTVGFFNQIGMYSPVYTALISSVVEFFGGLFLLLGALTRVSSFLLMVNMLVALFVVHIRQGFFESEFVLLLIAGLVAVFASGAGRLSLGSGFKSKWLQ